MIRFTLAVLIATACSLSAAESIREIKNAKEFDTALAAATGIVIVDFHAEWCPPCKSLGPILEAAVSENADKVTLLKVDVDQNPELSQRFSISSIPAVYRFKDGKQTATHVGLMDKAAVIAFIGL